MNIIIDTDIIYYLTTTSKDCHFDKIKFLNDIKSKNFNVYLTYYSLFEIMNKFSLRQDNKEFNDILTYFINNNFGIIYDYELDISITNLFQKCLSKNKKRYYRNKIKDNLIPYIAGILTGFSILFSLFWISIIGDNEKIYIDECKKTRQWTFEKLNILKNTLNNVYIEILNEYYSINLNKLKERKKILKSKINDTILDTFKVHKIIYEYYKQIKDKKCNELPNIEIIKNEIRTDKSITIDSISDDLKKHRNGKNFDNYFDSTFTFLFNYENNKLKYDIIKYVFKNLLLNHTFKFNDIIDYLNLLTPHSFKNHTNIFYITTDKNWIRFLEEYKNEDKYYLDLYNFIMNYYSI